jgi:hypothetical protein
MLEVKDVYRTFHSSGKDIIFYNKPFRTGVTLDRIYISTELLPRIDRVKHLAFPRCDHRAISCHISTNVIKGEKGYWKCNTNTLKDVHFQNDLKALWNNLRKDKPKENLGEWWDFCKVKFKDLIVIHSTRLQKMKRTRLNYLRYRLNQWHIKNPIPTPEEEQEKAEIEKDIKMELQRQIEGDKLRAKSLDLDSNDKPWDFFKRLEKSKVRQKLYRN